MKVVLFCGGQGVRMREVSARVPKPLIPVGNAPILLHIMAWYAFHGHRDFIICLGHQGDVIRRYFEDGTYPVEAGLIGAARPIGLPTTTPADWTITFAETGIVGPHGQPVTIGERLLAARPLLEDDEYFLASYGDALTDAPLPTMIAALRDAGMTASFVCARPTYSFHVVEFIPGGGGRVGDIRPVATNTWINGGYFVLQRRIFDDLHPGDELVEAPFRRLIARGQLLGHEHDGFWAPMDTLKDRQHLEALVATGAPPWAGWRAGASPPWAAPGTVPAAAVEG